MSGAGTDWAVWHAGYAEPGGHLARRAAAVREQLGAALDRAPAGPVALLSLCAGEGRDVLPVLGGHRRGPDVRAHLVELDPRLARAARAAVPDGAAVEVVQADAADPALLGRLAPVDVLLVCGVLGNLADDDVARTVAAVPALLRPGGSVLWTRHTRAPDRTPRIRGWFADAGVEETAFVVDPEGWSVGAGVLRGSARPLPEGRLFTFVR